MWRVGDGFPQPSEADARRPSALLWPRDYVAHRHRHARLLVARRVRLTTTRIAKQLTIEIPLRPHTIELSNSRFEFAFGNGEACFEIHQALRGQGP